MGKITYGMLISADGYYEDANGEIGFSAPDEQAHRLANEHARDASVFLFGRKLFEAMEKPWTEAAANQANLPEVEAEFAREYVATPRVVFSDTLTDVPDGVRLVRRADARAEVERLKRETDGELSLGGGALAASIVDLIDEFCPFVVPTMVGGGKKYFPEGVSIPLRLTEHRVFDSGTVFLRYARVIE
ncbi:MAG TPA: dihydrofolate reductase family protein [Candidatus Limnocylindrales bacterium]